MKIRTIRFENHPALGDLLLDFCDPETGEPFSTIILAGENGCGKTLILNEIYTTIGEQELNKNSGVIEIEVLIDHQNVVDLRARLNEGSLAVRNNVVKVRYEDISPGSWDNIVFSFTDGNSNVRRLTHQFFVPLSPRRPLRTFFSEAEVGFRSTSLQAITASGLDDQTPSRRSGPQLAQEIAQLLIDIRAADNEDVAVWLETHRQQTAVPPDISEKRMKRFKEAIAHIFPDKRFRTIKREGSRYLIEFEEKGRLSTLDQLSTGEKQIVFRGGFILRDSASVQGGLVLVDEPELSLHPTWQARILGFYQRLLHQDATTTTQLVVATHSPFVVHEQATSKVIILRRNPITGAIEVDPAPSYPTTNHARVIRAFNVEFLIGRADHDMVVLVEGTTDITIFKTAWSKLRPDIPPFFELRAALSHSAIRAILNDQQVFSNNPNKKIIGIFDFDSAFNQWNGTWKNSHVLVQSDATKCLTRKHPAQSGWSMLLPVPPFRSHLASLALAGASALSIELLFKDSDHLPNMMDRVPLPAPGAFKPEMKDSMKEAFARHVANLPPASFEALQPIFDRLEDIRDGRL
jgi:predicted ATPase